MTFVVPASKRGYEQNQFRFEIEGRTYVLPAMKYLRMRELKKLDVDADKVSVSLIFDLFADQPELCAALDNLDAEQFGELFKAWQQHSDITVGESSAS